MSDEDRSLRVAAPAKVAAGPRSVVKSLRIALREMGGPLPPRTLRGSTRRTASTAPAAPGPSRDDRAPRRVLRERRQGGRRGGHDRARRRRSSSRAHSIAELADAVATTGSASRAGSPSRWCKPAGADHYAADRLGRRVRPDRGRARSGSTRRTRRSSTPRAAPATRRRSSTSSSSARSARTTCPTARTCATSRAASR